MSRDITVSRVDDPRASPKRFARRLLSSRLASVVLPEPGKPHTIINLGPLRDLSIGDYSAGHDSAETPALPRVFRVTNGHPSD
jgi:hypothetical protein